MADTTNGGAYTNYTKGTFLRPATGKIQLGIQHIIKANVWNGSGMTTKTLGSIQKLTIKQSRSTQRCFELGNPECVEVTMGLVESISLSAERMKLQGQSDSALTAISGQQSSDNIAIQSLLDQSLYFDIVDVLRIPANAPNYTPTGKDPSKDGIQEVVLRTFRDCCITSYSENLNSSGDLRIIESVEMECRAVETGAV